MLKHREGLARDEEIYFIIAINNCLTIIRRKFHLASAYVHVLFILPESSV